jgi:hypothetical protein
VAPRRHPVRAIVPCRAEPPGQVEQVSATGDLQRGVQRRHRSQQQAQPELDAEQQRAEAGGNAEELRQSAARSARAAGTGDLVFAVEGARFMDSATWVPLPTELILARKQDGIGWLTINQPAKRNAISLAMWDAIGLAVEDFAAAGAVRVVVIHGAGGQSFAAGADISEFDKNRADAAEAAEYARRSAIARTALDRREKPVIAMIQGYCIGGGLALLWQKVVGAVRFWIPLAAVA